MAKKYPDCNEDSRPWTSVNVKLPPDLRRRVEIYRQQLAKSTPSHKAVPTCSDAVRDLLVAALDAKDAVKSTAVEQQSKLDGKPSPWGRGHG